MVKFDATIFWLMELSLLSWGGRGGDLVALLVFGLNSRNAAPRDTAGDAGAVAGHAAGSAGAKPNAPAPAVSLSVDGRSLPDTDPICAAEALHRAAALPTVLPAGRSLRRRAALATLRAPFPELLCDVHREMITWLSVDCKHFLSLWLSDLRIWPVEPPSPAPSPATRQPAPPARPTPRRSSRGRPREAGSSCRRP